MPNQFEIAGSQNPEKSHKTVPLATTKIFTGYWPNSAPYRDAAVQYLYEKFYGATRNDKIAAGLNVEVSPQMTLIRRPGNLVYNGFSFANVTGFYSFKPFIASVGEQVIVIADTTTAAYIITVDGIQQKTLLYTKSAGAGSTRFQQVGNTLFFGNGVDILKWSWFPGWQASTVYAAGTTIIDPNNNFETVLGAGLNIVSTSATGTTGVITYHGYNFRVNVGDEIEIVGMTTKTQYNGLTVKVLTVTTNGFPLNNTMTFSFTGPSYTTTLDTGYIVDLNAPIPTSGLTIPSFSGTPYTFVNDNGLGVIWENEGPSVQNLGIVAPTVAPTVVLTPLTPVVSWAANTYYFPPPATIIDSNSGTGPWVWELTTSGTTNGSVPSGLTTGTPQPQYAGGNIFTPTTVTDGTAVWTCNGLAAYTAGPYVLGQVAAISEYSTIVVNDVAISVEFQFFLRCVVSGTAAGGFLSPLPIALSAITLDNPSSTLQWQNIGYQITRLAAATSSPSGGTTASTVLGNVGDSQLVSLIDPIVDNNDFGEFVSVAGESGATHPTWSTVLGGTTSETGGLTWVNVGPSGAANTGVWFYAYSYENTITGDESTASPLSMPVLLTTNAGVQVSGPGSSDPQVNQINIYRTVQQVATATSGTPFLLATIPAPANGGSWTFLDTTPDPPNPGATLNVLITAAGYGLVNGLVSNYNDAPPAGLTNLTFHAGRLWGTVGNIDYYSTGPDTTVGNGATSWNVLNFFETPGVQNRLWPTTVGLFVFTSDGFWIIEGLGTSTNPFSPIQEVDSSISISTYDAFTTAGTQANVYTTDRLYISIDPQNGTSWLGQAVATDLLASYPPAGVYLTYHSNGLDQKGFISNSTQWLSWEIVPAPETGFLWNPPATPTITGGLGAVTSVETSAGIFQLLIGPLGTGPILARDSTFTTFSDNEVAYDAFAVIGNIVFAHHGQLGGLVFLAADYVRVGSEPIASALLDEIINQPSTPAWTIIPNPVNDPTNLPASSTLYQLRYWMIETQQPIYCRSALVKFDFGLDQVRNELLTFTWFGESLTEEIST